MAEDMREIRFNVTRRDPESTHPCCESMRPADDTGILPLMKQAACCAQDRQGTPEWVTGTVSTSAGNVYRISSDWSRSDVWEHIRCRKSSFRNRYAVNPGLYAIGAPDKGSDVFASANYKLSFDILRRALRGLNAWVLVLDTRGINVWCAAGKGTFGADQLIRRISEARLERVVDHKRIILPQLGAPGVNAHRVRHATGFRVFYGPVRADDIPAYLDAGHKATQEMRTVSFPLSDRFVLTPMEIGPAMKKFPFYAIAVLVAFGLQPSGILFRDAFLRGTPFLLLGVASVLAGAFFTPLLLPYIPFRSFAVKGWIVGLLSVIITLNGMEMNHKNTALLIFTYLFFPLASSYIALQFTGSTPFTGMSGVKKELRVAIPLYLTGAVVSILLLLFFKLAEWRVI